MKKNVILMVLTGVSLIGLAVDYFNLTSYTITDPITNLSLALFAVVVILLPFRDQVFRSCLKFAMWYLPLSVFLIVLAPTHGHGFLPPLMTKELASLLLGGLFVLISLLIISVLFFSRKSSVIKALLGE